MYVLVLSSVGRPSTAFECREMKKNNNNNENALAGKREEGRCSGEA